MWNNCFTYCKGVIKMDEMTFLTTLSNQDIKLSKDQLNQFDRYYQLLVEWNQKINLTAITQREEVYLKHFYDSLICLWQMPLESYQIKLCDVGAGAGFPSLPLKIVRPELKVTIVDSLKKRTHFLELLVSELKFDNVEIIHARAEDFGHLEKQRESFDLVTARAVARLNTLSEYCLPLVSLGGNFLALKGDWNLCQEELNEAKRALNILGGRVVQSNYCQLPENQGERSFLLINKVEKTPKKYPRQAGKPSKQPII